MSCIHCGQPLAGSDAQQSDTFCCRGCEGVHRLIHQLGLSDYYDFRPEMPAGAVEVANSSQWTMDGESAREYLYEGQYHCLLDGLHCAACAWLVERAVERLEGVSEVQVNYSTQRLRIRPRPGYENLLGEALKRVHQLGYRAIPYDPSRQERPRARADRKLLLRFGVAASVAGNVMLAAWALYSGADNDLGYRPFFHKLSLVLTLPVVFFSAVPFWTGARNALRQGQITTDVSIALGLAITFLYSFVATILGHQHVYFDTVTMFVFVLLLGRLLEGGARTQAGASLERLLSLQSRSARRWNGSLYEEIPSQRLQVGDQVEVAAGQRVPADGVVLRGRSYVDESHLTGESQPKALAPGSQVLGGSLALDGCLEIQLTQTGGSSLLAQVARLLEDNQAKPTQIQKSADRVARILLPAILLLTLATFCLGMALGWPSTEALDRALAVLIITCPCALGIATPLVMSLTCGVGARHGLLFRDGQAVETARQITHVVLDKTGTLTQGELGLQNNSPWLSWAASLEGNCHHPLARAFERAYQGVKLPVESWTQVAGLGVAGIIEGKPCRLGRADFLGRPELERTARGTTVWLEVDGQVVAQFEFRDQLRGESPAFVQALKNRGIEVCLASGDRPQVVAEVADAVGIEHYRSACLPQDKVDWVKALQAEGAIVAFIGDGINDAPALQQAHLGISVANGSPLSWEAADLVLLRPGLQPAEQALQLARVSYRHLHANLVLALVYNLVAIPSAMMGWVTPLAAAVAMPLSSLVVVAQSLILMGYHPQKEAGGLKWTHSIFSFRRP